MNSVIALAAGHDVSARTTMYAVVSGATVNLVGSRSTMNSVISLATGHDVSARATVYAVVSGSTVNSVSS